MNTKKSALKKALLSSATMVHLFVHLLSEIKICIHARRER